MSTSSAELKDYDLEEKGAASPLESGEVVSAHDGVNREAGAVAWLWRISKKLDSYGVEVRGVERVPEHERNHPSYFDAGFLWMSANMTISTFSLGTLGISLNGLNSTDACLTILFFNLLTTLPVATFSTWGKCTGLRQMIIGRFSFGPWTILFPILLNCLACIGWSTINTIVGASALHNVTTHNQLPEPAGIVIIALITLAVALFGYRWVHALERYASIPVFVIFIIMFGQAGRFMEGGFAGAGEAEAAAVLSFGGTIAGFALGWTSLAADYTVNFPVETPSWKVWLATYFGLNFPMVLIECLGALMMSTFKNKPTWGESYESQGESLGALLAAPLVGPMGGFGRFLLVILALSIVANNIPNVYSFALTFQSFGRYAQAIPRFFLCIVCTAIYIALAEAGYNSFHDAFDLLLVLLAYWLAIYSAVLLIEHFVFRGGSFSNYDLDAYNTYKKLPVGLAAFGGCACGVAGAVVGMAQKWYIGPLGASFGGPFGADIGFELAFAFTCVGYPPLRYLERKYTGR